MARKKTEEETPAENIKAIPVPSFEGATEESVDAAIKFNHEAVIETSIEVNKPVDENAPIVEVDPETFGFRQESGSLVIGKAYTGKKENSLLVCGHVDEHSLGPDGKPDHPTCDLKQGHAGGHHGFHEAKVEVGREYDKVYGKLIDIHYEVQDVESWWNDAAGTPAKDIKPKKLQPRNKKGKLIQAIEEMMP